MADQKALVVKSGVQSQIANADTLLVGSALDVSAAGALSVGTTTATSLTIGSSGVVSTVKGTLQMDGIAAPAVSPAGSGRIYFDSSANVFKASENGGAYTNLVGGGGGPTYTTTTTAVSKTIASFERCFVTAPSQTITLPASPSVGDEVTVGVLDFSDTLVARNGNLIMSLSQDLTINQPNVAVTLLYVSASLGWRII